MKSLWWIVLCYCLAPRMAAGISGGEIIAEVQKRLSDYKTFSARFEKQFYWAGLDKRRNRAGRRTGTRERLRDVSEVAA